MFIQSSPSERKMAGFDWSLWLGTAEIEQWGWNDFPNGLTQLSATLDEAAQTTIVMWTGGTPGTHYQIKGFVEADDGRKEYEEFTILITPD